MLIRRRIREKKAVLIEKEAVKDLIASISNNIADGKIPDIAGSISDILQKHLRCNKILFLKYYRSNLELNYFTGFKGFERDIFKVRLNSTIQSKLKTIQGVSNIEMLNNIFIDNFKNVVESFGFRHFFPVYNRENLYGVYFIETDIDENDELLNLLTVTLSFNLSSAYHINIQNQKIGRFEKRIEYLNQQAKKSHEDSKDNKQLLDYSHLLEIRSCHKLIPEMLKILKDDSKFNKLGFYIRDDSEEKDIFSVRWNLDIKTDKALKDNFDSILNGVESGEIVKLDTAMNNNKIEKTDGQAELSSARLSSIDWANNKRAIIVVDSKQTDKEISSKLKNFSNEALPLMENIDRFEQAEALSYTDGLTGMYNFRYFKKRIIEEFKRAKRYNRKLALLIIDIDDLKIVNDRYGHLAGDALIKKFGDILIESVRVNDIVSRYGGDEFCLLMPDTNRDMALVFMERIISLISNGNNGFNWTKHKIKYTVSIGGAVFPDDAETENELIHVADMALLKAKSEGRNCFRIYNPKIEPCE